MDLSIVTMGTSALGSFAVGLLSGILITRRQMKRRLDSIPGAPRADFEKELSAARSRAASGREPRFGEALGRQSHRRFIHLTRHIQDSGGR